MNLYSILFESLFVIWIIFFLLLLVNLPGLIKFYCKPFTIKEFIPIIIVFGVFIILNVFLGSFTIKSPCKDLEHLSNAMYSINGYNGNSYFKMSYPAFSKIFLLAFYHIKTAFYFNVVLYFFEVLLLLSIIKRAFLSFQKAQSGLIILLVLPFLMIDPAVFDIVFRPHPFVLSRFLLTFFSFALLAYLDTGKKLLLALLIAVYPLMIYARLENCMVSVLVIYLLMKYKDPSGPVWPINVRLLSPKEWIFTIILFLFSFSYILLSLGDFFWSYGEIVLPAYESKSFLSIVVEYGKAYFSICIVGILFLILLKKGMLFRHNDSLIFLSIYALPLFFIIAASLTLHMGDFQRTVYLILPVSSFFILVAIDRIKDIISQRKHIFLFGILIIIVLYSVSRVYFYDSQELGKKQAQLVFDLYTVVPEECVLIVHDNFRYRYLAQEKIEFDQFLDKSTIDFNTTCYVGIFDYTCSGKLDDLHNEVFLNFQDEFNSDDYFKQCNKIRNNFVTMPIKEYHYKDSRLGIYYITGKKGNSMQ
ncbi:MAG: hypothetical protein GY754_19620 [bacterium]|nr:hypothetical protein [bacterium]